MYTNDDGATHEPGAAPTRRCQYCRRALCRSKSWRCHGERYRRNGRIIHLWNDPAAQTGPTAANLAAGNYTVIVTDANGCTAQTQIEINQPQALDAQIVSFSAPLCFGQNNGSATVGVTGGTGAYAYLWNDPALQSSATAANLAPGDYSVSIRDANNCGPSVSVSIPATPAIVVEVLSQSDPICAGDSNGSISVSASRRYRNPELCLEQQPTALH